MEMMSSRMRLLRNAKDMRVLNIVSVPGVPYLDIYDALLHKQDVEHIYSSVMNKLQPIWLMVTHALPAITVLGTGNLWSRAQLITLTGIATAYDADSIPNGDLIGASTFNAYWWNAFQENWLWWGVSPSRLSTVFVVKRAVWYSWSDAKLITS